MPPKKFESLYIRAPRLNQLTILNEVAVNPRLTQSEVARRCGLSVAMVNNYMKDLCSSGLLEYRRKSSKSVSYHVTDEGRRAAAAIESSHFDELVGMFGYAKERIRQLISKRGEGAIQRVVLIGSGDLAELVFHALDSAHVNIVGVCDPDPSRVGSEWCGREIMSPSQVRFLAPDSVIFTIRLPKDGEQLVALIDRGIRIIRLDEVGYLGSTDLVMKTSGGRAAPLHQSSAGPEGISTGDQA